MNPHHSNFSISVVIPCFNSSPYLSKTIGSVLAQTVSPLEIIVVDDGSTDQSVRVLESYQGQIHIVRQKNLGVSWARNRGVNEALGSWVAFLDSDDIWDPKHIEISMTLLTETGADLSFCSLILFDSETGKFQGEWGPDPLDLQSFPQSLFLRNYIAPSGAIVRKKLLNQNPFREERKVQSCEDHDLWLTLVSQGAKFVHVPNLKVLYRKNHEGAATGNRERMFLADIEVMKKQWGNKSFSWRTKLKGMSQNYALLGDFYLSQGNKKALAAIFKSWAYQPLKLKRFKRLIKVSALFLNQALGLSKFVDTKV